MKILIVDDEAANLDLLRETLSDLYELVYARNGKSALVQVKKHLPDLILLDVMMPEMNGYEVCSRLKADEKLSKIPVIFVTAMDTEDDEQRGFELGAVDYITKPISRSIVRARVRTHLSLVKVEVLETTRHLIIQRLGRAAEFKDNETGLHVIRMSHYSRILALALRQSDEWSEMLLNAAPMHDVGKIGVPDNVLLKAGPLNDTEWKVMRQHPGKGAAIIGKHDSLLLKMAYEAALSHHEKWNGQGYPNGLSGEAIAFSARIIAVADVFDALTTKRPYKRAWGVDEAVNLMNSEAGKHFDPSMIPVFLREDVFRDILEVKQKWAERS